MIRNFNTYALLRLHASVPNVYAKTERVRRQHFVRFGLSPIADSVSIAKTHIRIFTRIDNTYAHVVEYMCMCNVRTAHTKYQTERFAIKIYYNSGIHTMLYCIVERESASETEAAKISRVVW